MSNLINAMKHVKAYMEKYKPKYSGVEDDRYCSPYNDLNEAIKESELELPDNITIQVSLNQYGSRLTDVENINNINDLLEFISEYFEQE